MCTVTQRYSGRSATEIAPVVIMCQSLDKKDNLNPPQFTRVLICDCNLELSTNKASLQCNCKILLAHHENAEEPMVIRDATKAMGA